MCAYGFGIWMFSIWPSVAQKHHKILISSTITAVIVTAIALYFMLYVVHRIETELFVLIYISNKERSQMKQILNLVPDAVFVTEISEGPPTSANQNNSEAPVISDTASPFLGSKNLLANYSAKQVIEWALKLDSGALATSGGVIKDTKIH